MFGREEELQDEIAKLKVENEKLKLIFSNVIAIIPTEKESKEYANGYFGYDEHANYQESAFISGVNWVRQEIENKLKDK